MQKKATSNTKTHHSISSFTASTSFCFGLPQLTRKKAKHQKNKMRFSLVLVLVVLLAITDVSKASSSSRRCRRRRLTTAQRCFNPPVEPFVDLSAYTGLWHQLYTSGDASIVSNNTCATANYTLLSTRPLTVQALNCEYLPGMNPRPQCVRGTVTRRPNTQFNTQLQVRFFRFAPPGAYNIAAILGDKNYGYYAAAVYSCRRLPNGKLTDGFYLISRSPYAPRFVQSRLIRKLRCNGYRVSTRTLRFKPVFEPSFNGPTCEYINPNGNNFNVNAPVPVF